MAEVIFQELLRPAAVGAAAAFLVCLLRMPIARTMQLVDTPNLDRKTHAGSVPLVGGIAVFPAIAIACVQAVAGGASDDAIAVMIGVVFGFFMIGYADDRMHIRPSRRLLLSLVLFAALVLIPPGFMPDSFEIGDVSIHLGTGAIALLAIIGASGALNAINMADGQDGLCSGLLLIWLTYLAVTLSPALQSASAIVAVALLVVLAFNLAGVIFLGDIGAYGIGSFVLALMLAGTGDGSIDHGQIVALLAIPVTDCILLMVERKRRGRSPYDPDRQHLHHVLQSTLGKWPSLIVYLGAAMLGAYAACYDGWFLVVGIAAQIGFVVLARAYSRREPEITENASI